MLDGLYNIIIIYGLEFRVWRDELMAFFKRSGDMR